jgi:anthranilate/para-aminobenzoate synthase component I
VQRRLEVPADPIRLARALERAGLPHVALLHGRGRAWLSAAPDAVHEGIDPLEEDDDREDTPVPRWIGVIPYEARRSLERPTWRPPERREAPAFRRAEWLRYPSVVEIGDGVILHVGDERHARRLERVISIDPGPLREFEIAVTEADPPEAHRARIARALELIAAGDLYQVNLARRLDVRFEGEPLALYARLHEAAPSAYAAALSTPQGWVLSTSPELLLRLEANRSRLITEPIKGTRPRGADPEEDARLVRELDADPKERAELAMIVDVERNDLGTVCDAVTVARLPAVTTHATVHHRSALVQGILRAGVTRHEIFAAMVPSGSVTGAPKIRAMEVIAELEAHRRGLYTGGFGYVAADGGAVMAMAIRTLTLGEGRGEYFTGGGIVIDSDPDRELEETRWKAAQLMTAARARGASA